MALVAIALTAAPTASADTGGLVWPDPPSPPLGRQREPRQHRTRSLPTDDLYWKTGNDAGSTGRGATRCAGIHQFG